MSRRCVAHLLIGVVAVAALAACDKTPELPAPPPVVAAPEAQPPAPSTPTPSPPTPSPPVVSPPVDTPGRLIQRIDFETGDYSQVDQRQYQTQTCSDSSDYLDNSLYQIVRDPVGEGEYATRVHLRPCDERAEYVVQDEFLEADRTYRFRWMMMMPEDFNPDGERSALVQQTGARGPSATETAKQIVNDCGNPHSSTMRLFSDELYYRVRYPDGQQGGKTVLACRDYQIPPMVTGQWATFEMRIRWSQGADGFLELYKDGQQVVDFAGPLLWDGHEGPGDWKFGAYTGDPQDGEVILYFDGFTVEELPGS